MNNFYTSVKSKLYTNEKLKKKKKYLINFFIPKYINIRADKIKMYIIRRHNTTFCML